MPAPLSSDRRVRIVRAVEGGASIRKAALRYEVSPSTAVKLMRRVRATGSTSPARYGGHRRPVLEPHTELIGSVRLTLELHRIGLWATHGEGIASYQRSSL